MRILILCQFSKGICGVFNRVQQDAKQYIKEGHEVYIFSSNKVKGINETAPLIENQGDLAIWRFPARKLGGESFMLWDNQWKEEAIKLKPDLIIAHGYRHLHTTQALKIAKKIGCQCWLITHAPFIDGNITRTKVQSVIVKLYDKFIAPRTLNKFDKIIAICNWEIPYLLKLGANRNKIKVIKIKIPEEFYTIPIQKTKQKKDVLFLGRVSPIKDLETFILSAQKLPEINFSIVGSVEADYGWKLHNMIIDARMSNVEFYPPITDLKEKIKLIDNHKIVVLPSIREAMPSVLIEALARKKTIIASGNHGNREVIKGEPNCFLFKVGDFQKLSKLIEENI